MLRVALLILFVPLVEIGFLTWLAVHTSALLVFALVVGAGLMGAWLFRAQTRRTLSQISSDLDAGRMPTESLTDALIVAAAAGLLIVPGVLSDAVAVLLLVPSARRGIKGYLQRHFQARVWSARHEMAESLFERDQIIDVRVVRPPSGHLAM